MCCGSTPVTPAGVEVAQRCIPVYEQGTVLPSWMAGRLRALKHLILVFILVTVVLKKTLGIAVDARCNFRRIPL